MNSRVQCGVTAGVVIVGASVVAVAPMSLPTPTAQENPQVTAAVELTAVSDPLEAAIILAQGLAESGQRAGGAAALSPLTPGLVAAGLALGDNALAYSAIRQSIDAPLWAADPTIDALAKILPEPVGGTDGVHESDNGQDASSLISGTTSCGLRPTRSALPSGMPSGSARASMKIHRRLSARAPCNRESASS